MRCFKCGKKVDFFDEVCSRCGTNISFTTKNNTDKDLENLEKLSSGINFLNKTQVVAGLIGFAIVFIFIMVISSLSGFFYFNGLFSLLDKIINGLIILGIVTSVIYILILIFKKKNNMFLLLISIALVFGPLLAKEYIGYKNNISTKDYSKVEYIEFSNEKIPTLYSVVGERDIAISIEENNYLDEGMGVKVDFISIVYIDITDEDKITYKRELLDNGFKEKVFFADGEEIHLFVKNTKDKFYTINIDGLSISYSAGKGNFDEILKEALDE